MTTIELTQHPELSDLAAELRRGHSVVLTDHGQPMAEIIPARPKLTAWAARLQTLHASFTSPVYIGNSVVDERQGAR